MMRKTTMLVIALAAWAAACGAPPAGGEDGGNSPPLAGGDDGIPSDDHPAICGDGHRLTAAGEEHCSNPITTDDDPAVVPPDAGADDPEDPEPTVVDPNRTADGGCAPAPWPYRELSPCPGSNCRIHQNMETCLWACGTRRYTLEGKMWWTDGWFDASGEDLPLICPQPQ